MNNPSRQTVTRLVSVFTVWGLITLLSACAVFTNDNQTTTFYFIRHAEIDSSTPDKPLNDQGKQRAQSLATHFQDRDISPLGPTLQT